MGADAIGLARSYPLTVSFCSFYDMSLVEKEGLPPNTPHPDLQKIDVSSSASGAPFMILGDTEGYVHLVDKDFNAQRFKAFDKDVLLMEYLHVSPHADDNSRMTDRRSHSMLCQRISLDTIHCTCTCTHESTTPTCTMRARHCSPVHITESARAYRARTAYARHAPFSCCGD